MKTQTPMTTDLAHPMQPIGWDGTGVIRFKQNAIVNAMVEECRDRGGLDLNKVAIAVARGGFSNEDQVQLAQLIGYSVSGFGDLDYVPEAVVQAADLQAEAVGNNKTTPHPTRKTTEEIRYALEEIAESTKRHELLVGFEHGPPTNKELQQRLDIIYGLAKRLLEDLS